MIETVGGDFRPVLSLGENESAALYSQAVLQGAFILAKAQHGPKVAADCLDHLTRYFETLLPIAGWNTRRPEALA